MEITSNTFDRYCYSNGECHCDWRLQIYDCEEEYSGLIINIVNIALSVLVIVIGVILLYHRVIIKGQRFFDTTGVRGCLRPKPIEVMLLFLTIYNIFRLLSSAILVSNVADGNIMARQWFFEFAWPFGLGGFVLYLIGIAQTLADSHKAIATGWLPSPLVVDIFGCTIFFAPIVLSEPTSLLTGYLATTNMDGAEILVRIHYLIWVVYCFVVIAAVLYCGTRLCRILNAHLEKINLGGPRYDAIKTGIIKIRMVMFLIAVCLSMFAIMMIMYVSLRDQILQNTAGNMAIGGLWCLLGPVTTFFVELAVTFNPKAANILRLGSKSSSSNEKSTNMYNSDFTSTCANNNEVGTLSRNAFDDLKQQQMYHQQQKHHRQQQRGQLQSDIGDSGDLTSGIKSETVVKILNGDIELAHTASSSSNKGAGLSSKLQRSTSAKTSVTEDDATQIQDYSSRISLILRDKE
ncbi:hypothetical protein BDA99DRAFT_496462 [Phascolomyces articulosus]|uniref:Uncharacterized protein n=1 Tax=Phascolomyces articulosus TaxID=60185 RepID=A0AAD5K9Q4_9FUNG|nr:hypothetical protein BDA99DRAFT_496462 [Phascolomyces articulosus]